VPSPTVFNLVYGVFHPQFVSGMHGMYRSDDAGATWHLLDFRRAGTPFAVDPADASLVYFRDDQQIFETRDLRHGPGEPRIRTLGSFPNKVTAAAMSPDGAVFWVATEARTWHRSADGGKMWRALDAAPAERAFVSLGVDPNDSAVVFGITDDGALWVYRDAEMISAR